jgi:hypothetical protein
MIMIIIKGSKNRLLVGLSESKRVPNQNQGFMTSLLQSVME